MQRPAVPLLVQRPGRGPRPPTMAKPGAGPAWLAGIRSRLALRKAAKRKQAKPARSPAVAWMQVQSYKLVGRRLEREEPHLTDALERAGLPLSPGLYYGMMVCAGVVGLVLFTLLASVGFYLVMGAHGIAYGVLVGAVAGALSAGAFPFVVRSRTQNRAHAIDRELPFTLSELSVLAGIGLSPITLMRRMSLRPHDPATTGAFRAMVAMVDTEGRDLVSAMSETARKSPSDALRSTLWDMANLMHQGGDLETYLKGMSETVLESVRASQKSFTEQLGTYADMYISIVLLGIMFLAVGAFILDAFRSTAGPLSADGLLLLLTWGLGPLIVIVLGLLLSSAHGASR